MNSTKWLGIAVAVAAVVLLGVWMNRSNKSTPVDQDQNAQQSSDTIKLSSKQGGKFLVDAKGMTLYYFPKDNINKSNCAAGQCLTAWPVFYSDETVVSSPLKKDNFGEITRDDGIEQSTYLGWPLYYYFKDAKAGDTLGEGVGDVWYILPEPFYTVMIQNQESVGGNYLISPNGMTLYYFTNDKQGTGTTPPQSNCSGTCLASWPAFYPGSVIAPSLLKNSDFTTFQRSSGANQLAYKGWPLYYYASDTKPGEVKGQGLNKVWFVVKP